MEPRPLNGALYWSIAPMPDCAVVWSQCSCIFLVQPVQNAIAVQERCVLVAAAVADRLNGVVHRPLYSLERHSDDVIKSSSGDTITVKGPYYTQWFPHHTAPSTPGEAAAFLRKRAADLLFETP